MANSIRRRDVLTLAAGAVALPIAARAQKAESMRRVGILVGVDTVGLVDAFKKGLAGLGWTEGRNIRFEERRPDTGEQLPLYAAQLASLEPDAIFVIASPSLRAMRHATSDVPIVFVGVDDPVGQGFVSSLAHPGGNITGFAAFEFSVASKQLALLQKLAPTVERVACMYGGSSESPLAPAVGAVWAVIETAAPSLSLQATKMPVRTAEDIKRAIVALGREPNGGLYVMPSVVTNPYRELIAKLAMQYRLPSMHTYRFYVLSGGLAAYGSDILDLSRWAAASYVDRILKGEKPRDLPVQLPTRFQFIVNLKTARAIGLDIPPNVVALVDEVIE